MQRLADWHLFARLCARTAQQQQLSATAAAATRSAGAADACCSWVRHASGDASPPEEPGAQPASDTQPASTAAGGAAVDAATSADATAAGGGDEGGDEEEGEWQLTREGFEAAMKNDGTWLERPNRRPTRAEKGSYVDNADLEGELEDMSIKIPEHIPLYDLRTAAPGLFQPRSDVLETLLQYGEEHVDELLDEMGIDTDERGAVEQGGRPILRWLVRMRLDVSGIPHPINRKVVCSVYLRELQEETGLSDAALRHIALVAGQRYNPNKGELKLVSERYAAREENRVHIMEMLQALVAEGERVHPSQRQAEAASS